MLKRFIRDCVYREAAVYSPWIVKPSVAARYAIPTEMTDEIKEEIATFREAQMDRRKREREERLGILPGEGEEEDSKDRRKKAKKEEVKVEEDIKKRPMKYPAEGEFSFIFMRVRWAMAYRQTFWSSMRRRMKKRVDRKSGLLQVGTYRSGINLRNCSYAGVSSMSWGG
jgi:hypothetical protein